VFVHGVSVLSLIRLDGTPPFRAVTGALQV
jgi:hypothetical protein